MSVARTGQLLINSDAAASNTTVWNIGAADSIVVTVAYDLSATITSITYADVALSLVGTKTSVADATTKISVYALPGPLADFDAHDLVTTFSGICNSSILGVRFTGTDATNPVENFTSGELTDDGQSLGTITNASGDIAWVYALITPSATIDEAIVWSPSAGVNLTDRAFPAGVPTRTFSMNYNATDVNPTATTGDGAIGAKWTYIAYSVTALAAAPTATGCSPALGTTAGGTAVTITGTGFSGSTVAIGGVACTSVVVVGATSITCVTGAHAAALVNVVVTNADTQTGTKTNGYTYVAPAAGGGAVNPLLLRERYVLINRAPGVGIWKP